VVSIIVLRLFTLLMTIITVLIQPATGASVTCQGSNVTLQCVILRNGVPVDLIWRRNGTLVDSNILTNHRSVFNSTYNANTDLVITNVSLEDDNAEYECTTISSGITSSLVLNVKGNTLYYVVVHYCKHCTVCTMPLKVVY